MKMDNNKWSTYGLWTAQILTALMLFWAAYMKLVSPETIAESMPWTTEMPALVKFTGLVDLLAGIGLVFPVLLNIKPRLTIWAALGLALLMIAGSIFHLMRNEADKVPMNIVIFFISLFIAWGWSRKLTKK